MPGSVITTAAPGGIIDFLHLTWKGTFGIAGFLLALNIGDSAHRIYEFATHRGPFAPGPGFSPLVIRIVGSLIGGVSTWSFVQSLTS